MVSVTVCIASMGRASLLETLQSLAACQRPAGVALDVVIADDSPSGAVAALLAGRETAWPFPLAIVPTAARNIAVARNACLAAAGGDFLAFVDDDERVHPEWLASLLEQAAATQADAIFGPVDPVFPPDTPDWLAHEAFARDFASHGSRVATGRTGNALVRRATVERLGLRFREQFGRTGGEDTDFFFRLGLGGALMLASETARVSEEVPPVRLRLSHLFRRYTRGGQTYALVTQESARPLARMGFYAGAAAKLCVSFGLALANLPFRKNLALRWALRACLNGGKLSHGLGLPLLRLY